MLFTLKFGDMGADAFYHCGDHVVLIFGEISPKSIANNCPEQLAMLSAPVVQFLIWIFLPLNILFVGWQKLLTKIFHLESSSKMSQEELLTLVNEVQEDGTIDEDEGGLLRNAIEFSDQEARDILIHRTDLAALPITATKEEIAEMFTETKFSLSADLPGYHRRYSGNHPPEGFLCGAWNYGKGSEGYHFPGYLCSGERAYPDDSEETAESQDPGGRGGRRVRRHLRHCDDGGHSGGAGGRDLGRA